MKLHFLGTCAGTEPMERRQHMSVVLEVNDRLYFFDAGEGCSRTAHLMGLDLLKTEKIIISHPHIDHIGGLPNLLWCIRKIAWTKNQTPGAVDLYIPRQSILDGVMQLLKGEEDFMRKLPINAHKVEDGILFDDGCVKMTAIHNTHIKMTEEKEWTSFSYLVEAENKKIVFSGDLGEYQELDPLIGDGCDIAILETGHFHIDDTYVYAKDKKIGKVLFCHNGRELLNFPKQSAEKIERLFGKKAIICEDRTTIEIN